MSLTLGLIVWFYERRKKNKKTQRGKRQEEQKEHDHGRKKKDGKIGKQTEEKIGSIAYFYAQ